MISSERRSAAETKSAGPLRETCRFSTSPKSRLRPRAAFIAAPTMTLRIADRAMHRSPGKRRFAHVSGARASRSARLDGASADHEEFSPKLAGRGGWALAHPADV